MNDRPAQTALVGAWRLVSWENRAADGQVTYPMGSDALGYLLYTAGFKHLKGRQELAEVYRIRWVGTSTATTEPSEETAHAE